MDQMDIYWETASRTVTIVTIGISACFFAKFLKPFLNRHRYAWEAGGAYVVTMLIMYFVPWELLGMTAEAIGFTILFAVMCLRDRVDQFGHFCGSRVPPQGMREGRAGKRIHLPAAPRSRASLACCGFKGIRNLEQKIFLAVVMYLIAWFSHGITLPFRDALYRVILFSPKIMHMHVMVYFGFYIVVEAICLTLRFGVMFFLFRTIDHVYIYKKENISKKELGLLLSIPLSVLSGYIAFTFFFESYLADIQQYIQDNHLEYNWVKALYQIVSFGAIFSSIVLYQKIKESYRQEKERAVLEEQTESMKRHMEEVEALYRDIRGLKHDMGNHVMILENLCRNNQQEAISYLSNLKGEFHEIASGIRTGNPITDVVIAEKGKEASRKGIAFSCSFRYPEGTAVNAFDVSVILGNALGNAIEGSASCEEPFIQVCSYQERNAYLIEVRNNFTGELLLDGESGMPVTTKENREEHGCGLINIQRVARKYFGEIEVRQDNDIFILHVMLML